ncbi:hypothetical protein Tco_0464349 [Tanacetum coccineum]
MFNNTKLQEEGGSVKEMTILYYDLRKWKTQNMILHSSIYSNDIYNYVILDGKKLKELSGQNICLNGPEFNQLIKKSDDEPSYKSAFGSEVTIFIINENDEQIKHVARNAYDEASKNNKDLLQKVQQTKYDFDQSIEMYRGKESGSPDRSMVVVESGCSKHMTGDRALLRNFIEKFMGTVRFGNDNFAAITGYGDYLHGNITICHVYYVEGLGHNLFSVGQNLVIEIWKWAFIPVLEQVMFGNPVEGDDLLIADAIQIYILTPIVRHGASSNTFV